MSWVLGSWVYGPAVPGGLSGVCRAAGDTGSLVVCTSDNVEAYAPFHWDLDPGSRKPYGKSFASVFFGEFGGWLGEHIANKETAKPASLVHFLGIYIT
jgi:hypothetical protein